MDFRIKITICDDEAADIKNRRDEQRLLFEHMARRRTWTRQAQNVSGTCGKRFWAELTGDDDFYLKIKMVRQIRQNIDRLENLTEPLWGRRSECGGMEASIGFHFWQR